MRAPHILNLDTRLKHRTTLRAGFVSFEQICFTIFIGLSEFLTENKRPLSSHSVYWWVQEQDNVSSTSFSTRTLKVSYKWKGLRPRISKTSNSRLT